MQLVPAPAPPVHPRNPGGASRQNIPPDAPPDFRLFPQVIETKAPKSSHQTIVTRARKVRHHATACRFAHRHPPVRKRAPCYKRNSVRFTLRSTAWNQPQTSH